MNEKINYIRSFNRFYTSHLGILNHHVLDSPYSLAEVRVLYEIGEHQSITAQTLSSLLSIDNGYLSRILKLLKKNRIIKKEQSVQDGRVYHIMLTPTGKELLRSLQHKSNEQIRHFITRLTPYESDMLVNAMRTIRNLLSNDYSNTMLAKDVMYREGLKPGDIGYLIYLHGILYAEESGYTEHFEGYVAKTFYEFLEHYQPDQDKVWLATYNDQIIGCIAILSRPDQSAQLRWFLVHPVFRGTGIGKKLFETALAYCYKTKFKRVYLLTTDVQQRAITMYKKAGFHRSSSLEVKQWGRTLYEERYDLVLDQHL